MPYVFDLEDIDDLQIEVDLQGSSSINFTLGYDTDSNLLALMSVMLVSGESYLEASFERILDLQFALRTVNLESGAVSDPDYDSRNAGNYIPRQHRPDVLNNILKCIESLLYRENPDYLTMETFLPQLEGKPLKKYAVIEEHIRMLGYELQDKFRDNDTGVDYWFFRRKPI